MIAKYCNGACPEDSGGCAGAGIEWADFTREQADRSITAMEAFDLAGAIAAAMKIVRQVDTFINETAPFKLAKDPDNATQVGDILYRCAEAIRIAACLLEAVMPEKVQELRSAWNLGDATPDLRGECEWGRLRAGTSIEKVALFPRLELEEVAG